MGSHCDPGLRPGAGHSSTASSCAAWTQSIGGGLAVLNVFQPCINYEVAAELNSYNFTYHKADLVIAWGGS